MRLGPGSGALETLDEVRDQTLHRHACTAQAFIQHRRPCIDRAQELAVWLGLRCLTKILPNARWWFISTSSKTSTTLREGSKGLSSHCKNSLLAMAKCPHREQETTISRYALTAILRFSYSCCVAL